MGQPTNKTAKELILNLLDAGITQDYVNVILNQVKEEKVTSFYDGHSAGKAKVRGKLLTKINDRDNYNGQFLTNFIKNL